MQQLPKNKHLPINLLVACFNKTSATYKYYWLLGIIHSLESGKTMMLKKELFARMISTAWYTVNYFHVSFGIQDKLQRAIENIKNEENLTIDADKEIIFNTLIETKNRNTLQHLQYFNNQVPHWFLSPWFPGTNKQKIYKESQNFKDQCPYALHDDFIQINFSWVNYFLENAGLIKDFCYWNLVMYLQTKNPNIPDIPSKLIRPAMRNNLTKQRHFWDIVFREKGSVNCIYTEKPLSIGNYAVEHFVPYSFVSHDLIWNLIPADQSFNSSKSDKLPSMEKYFNSFYKLQKSAIEIIKEKSPSHKLLEDYLTIFPNIFDMQNLDIDFTEQRFKDKIQPLITIASNNGFDFLK